MSASVTNDKLTQSMNGGNPVVTTVSSARSIGGTTLSCVSLDKWPTDTAVYFVTYQKKTDGSMDTTTLCSWKGVVSASTVGSLTLENGTDAGNAVGDYVEMGPTAAWAQGLYDFGTRSHKTDGTLKDGIVTTSAINDGAVTAGKTDFSTYAQNLADTEYAVQGLYFLGQQVYQKIVTTGALPNTTSKIVNHGITSLQYLTQIYGTAWTAGITTLPLPFVNDSNTTAGQVAVVVNGTQVVITTTSNRTSFANSYVVLRYTKTA